MILNVHSDASYLMVTNEHSRTGGHYFLGGLSKDGKPVFLNGTIYSQFLVLKIIAASTAEAELGALFLNTQEAKNIQPTLIEMGHP